MGRTTIGVTTELRDRIKTESGELPINQYLVKVMDGYRESKSELDIIRETTLKHMAKLDDDYKTLFMLIQSEGIERVSLRRDLEQLIELFSCLANAVIKRNRDKELAALLREITDRHSAKDKRVSLGEELKTSPLRVPEGEAGYWADTANELKSRLDGMRNGS